MNRFAWLLDRVPGLEVSHGRGTLLGDYQADALEIALPGAAGF